LLARFPARVSPWHILIIARCAGMRCDPCHRPANCPASALGSPDILMGSELLDDSYGQQRGLRAQGVR
jgi:hypothetical protein